MSTKPHHGYEDIALDGERVSTAAKKDVHDKTFGKHVSAHDLAAFDAQIAKLKAASGARSTKLDEQLGAGTHVAEVRAALFAICIDVRDAGELVWLADVKSKDQTKARKFGYGHAIDASSTSSVERFARMLLESAEASPHDAAKVHLDAKGKRHLEDALSALEGADNAHVVAKQNRHESSTALDSLAHVVSAETARVRFVAERAFRGDESKLAGYESTLPRHAVKHRTAPAPAAPAT